MEYSQRAAGGRSALAAAGASSLGGHHANGSGGDGEMDKLRLANQLLRTQVRELSTALVAAKERGHTSESVGTGGGGRESAALERRRLLAALNGKDKALRVMTRKFEAARSAALKARKAAAAATTGERAADLENERRALVRQLEAVSAENRALKKMQRQLVQRMESQDAAVEDMPARIAALQEEVRVATERIRVYRDEAQRASATGDGHRERLMRLQGEHRRLKKKLAAEGIPTGTKRKKGKSSASGSSTPASMASPGSMASPAASDVFRRSKAKWDGQKDELLQRIMMLERDLVDAKAAAKAPGGARPRDSMAAGNPEAEEAQRLLRANVAELTRLKQSMAKQQKALEEKQAELDKTAAQLTQQAPAAAPTPAPALAPAASPAVNESWAGPRSSPGGALCGASGQAPAASGRTAASGYSDEYEASGDGQESVPDSTPAPAPAPAPAPGAQAEAEVENEYVPSFLRGAGGASKTSMSSNNAFSKPSFGSDSPKSEYKPSFMSSSPAPAPAPSGGGGGEYKPSFMSSSPAPAPAPSGGGGGEYKPSFMSSSPAPAPAPSGGGGGEYVPSFLQSGPVQPSTTQMGASAATGGGSGGNKVTSAASGLPAWLVDEMESAPASPAKAPAPAPAPAPATGGGSGFGAPAFGNGSAVPSFGSGGGGGGGGGGSFGAPAFSKKNNMDWF